MPSDKIVIMYTDIYHASRRPYFFNRTEIPASSGAKSNQQREAAGWSYYLFTPTTPKKGKKAIKALDGTTFEGNNIKVKEQVVTEDSE